jgi:hypothetical protein
MLEMKPGEKTPTKTSITVQKHPENEIQSSLVGSTSKLIHLPCVFVGGKSGYSLKCVFNTICCPQNQKCP